MLRRGNGRKGGRIEGLHNIMCNYSVFRLKAVDVWWVEAQGPKEQRCLMSDGKGDEGEANEESERSKTKKKQGSIQKKGKLSHTRSNAYSKRVRTRARADW
jgi:hypothetical protein